MEDKPYKTYNELIDILINEHGLIINDRNRAIEQLKVFPYYDLINGYKDHFMIQDKYINGITLDHIVLYSLFDRSFQNILFKYSVYIENRFKNVVANVIAKHFGVTITDYLNEQKYEKTSNSARRSKRIILFKSINIVANNKNIPQPTQHYLETKNHVPPWILFHNVSFSSVIDLYTFLPTNLKEEIANEMIGISVNITDKVELLYHSVTIVRIFRNIIAHNLKFVTGTSGRYKIETKRIRKRLIGTLLIVNDINQYRGINDRFSMVIASVLLLGSETLIYQFSSDIINLQNQFRTPADQSIINEYYKNVDIPNDIADRMMKYGTAFSKQQI